MNNWNVITTHKCWWQCPTLTRTRHFSEVSVSLGVYLFSFMLMMMQELNSCQLDSCSECSEVHVAKTGHGILDCEGRTSSTRHSSHAWVKGSINDILVPIESYHLFDPFGRRIMH